MKGSCVTLGNTSMASLVAASSLHGRKAPARGGCSGPVPSPAPAFALGGRRPVLSSCAHWLAKKKLVPPEGLKNASEDAEDDDDEEDEEQKKEEDEESPNVATATPLAAAPVVPAVTDADGAVGPVAQASASWAAVAHAAR